MTIRICVFKLLWYWMRSRSIFQINHAFLTWFDISRNDVSPMCLMISPFSSILFLIFNVLKNMSIHKKYRFLSINVSTKQTHSCQSSIKFDNLIDCMQKTYVLDGAQFSCPEVGAANKKWFAKWKIYPQMKF